MASTSRGWSGGSPVPGDVLECLEELGITVTRIINEEAWAICPGHLSRLGRPNRHPNKWSVNLDTGEHSCFSCGFRGSFATLVREVLGYDRHDAEQWVRRRGGVARLRRILDYSQGRIDREQEDSRIRPWNEARLALFTEPPAEALSARRVSSGSVKQYGVLWDEKEKNWILPIRDPHTGALWGYQEKGEGWFSNKPYQVPKSETLFGIDCFDSRTALLLESPLDDLRCATAGVDGALSSFGVQISDTQLEIAFDIAEVVIFGMDNDAAGIKKSLELKERYLKSGKRIKFLNYEQITWAKDLGTEGVSVEQIQWAYQNAIPLVNYRPCF